MFKEYNGVIIGAVYDINAPELDVTYSKIQKYSQVKEPFALSDLSSRKPLKEFEILNKIFDWGSSKPFITQCKNLNIYTDVAPF